MAGRFRTMMLIGVALAGVLGVAACETIPYEERVAAYEASVRQRFMGQSADTLVLALGPPERTFTLSDGREMFQYSLDETRTRGGDSYTTYETSTRVREVRAPDGTVSQVEEKITVPVVRTNPVYTERRTCIRRFIIDQNDMVQDFAWQGNACF